MPRPRRIQRLRLGPVVGHTDDASSRVWIQVVDDPRNYALRVEGAGVFPFLSTEGGVLEFRTGIALATGLRADWSYRYTVLRAGRTVPGASGSFRTAPGPSSMTNLTFCVISCTSAEREGAWEAFADYVDRAKPHFVLLVGDQVYFDEDKPDVFADHFRSTAETRRRAMAAKYRPNWSRSPVRRILANVPTYMVWDDHDIRDGWGSSAADSPTLAAKYPRGRRIYDQSVAYFEDARDVYWHFQRVRAPLPGDILDPGMDNYVGAPPLHGQRQAMPYVFRCGRLVVLMLDSRGDRDVFRNADPILGTEQWQFIDRVFANLPAEVEALAVVTPTPIASLDPDGNVMKLMGNRTDDIEAFKRGDEEELFHPESTEDIADLGLAALGARATRLLGQPVNLGSFKVSNIDEARDQWSHKYSRREQAELIRKAAAARLTNRPGGSPRGLVFLSGDIHMGCMFDIEVLRPKAKIASLTSSGISQVEDRTLVLGIFVDENVPVSFGIQSTLRDVIPDFNFGVVEVLPTGRGAEIHGSIAHSGNAFTAGADISDLL
jgi:hypothetical protein